MRRVPVESYKALSDWDQDHKYLNRRRGLPLIKEYEIGPDVSKLPLYTRVGTPINRRYHRGDFKRPRTELFEPSPWMPITRFTRDPWWWSWPQYRPFEAPVTRMKYSPFYLRDSYLSPIKRNYLWDRHPIRLFSTTRRLILKLY